MPADKSPPPGPRPPKRRADFSFAGRTDSFSGHGFGGCSHASPLQFRLRYSQDGFLIPGHLGHALRMSSGVFRAGGGLADKRALTARDRRQISRIFQTLSQCIRTGGAPAGVIARYVPRRGTRACKMAAGAKDDGFWISVGLGHTGPTHGFAQVGTLASLRRPPPGRPPPRGGSRPGDSLRARDHSPRSLRLPWRLGCSGPPVPIPRSGSLRPIIAGPPSGRPPFVWSWPVREDPGAVRQPRPRELRARRVEGVLLRVSTIHASAATGPSPGCRVSRMSVSLPRRGRPEGGPPPCGRRPAPPTTRPWCTVRRPGGPGRGWGGPST